MSQDYTLWASYLNPYRNANCLKFIALLDILNILEQNETFKMKGENRG